MKKIIILLIVLSVLLCGCGVSEQSEPVMSEVAEVEEPIPEPQPEPEPEPEPVSIAITAVGDCTLATDTHFHGKDGFVDTYNREDTDSTYFLANVKHLFEDDDLTIVNFEGTLSENGRRQDKQFAFRGKPEYVDILSCASVEAANLANNHSLDYGDEAFADTGNILSDSGIVWFEGENVTIKEIKGIKVGLIGTNLLDGRQKKKFLENLEYLKSLNPDLVIASFHWGIEKASKPDKWQKEYAHLAIDNGADLVIGHHPHVLQGVEEYNGKYILYSLGNFCFGGSKNPSDRDTAIFKQTFTFLENELVSAENPTIIPCSVTSHHRFNNFQPTPVYDEDFVRIQEKITKRSEDFAGIENVNFIYG